MNMAPHGKNEPSMTLWRARHLGTLANTLVECLADGDRDPVLALFEPKIIVVPNPLARTFVLQAIARSRLGAAFNVTTTSMGGLLRELSAGVVQDLRILNHAKMRNALLGLFLGTPTSVDLPPAVRAYLEAPNMVETPELRAFQLADRLAAWLVDYATETPEVTQAWARGEFIGVGEGPRTTEAWQRVLWRMLHADGGPLGGEWSWPAALWPLAIDTCQKLPQVIHVFASSHLDLGASEALQHLSRRTNVHVYLVAPSATRPTVFADVTAEIVYTWSAVPRRSAELVASHAQEKPPRPDDTALADQPTLLRATQDALWRQDYPQDRHQPDGSVRVLVCHGVQRECEAVADEIWRFMVEDEHGSGHRGGPLKFTDIAVLIADQAQTKAYAGELQAAFAENHGIPVNLGGLLGPGAASVDEAVTQLLDLSFCGFRRSSMLSFLGHPAVCRRFSASAELWAAACAAAGIFHGADADDHKGTYFSDDLYNWDQGLRRLALGELLAEPAPGEEHVVKLGTTGYLPVYRVPGGHGDVSALILPARALVADLKRLGAMQASLAQWGDAFAKMVEAYVGDDVGDGGERRSCAAAMRALGDDDPSAGRILLTATVACAAAKAALSGPRRHLGHLLAHGVHVAPLTAGAALPFRAVFICGLNDGVFPARQAGSELDIRPGGTGSSSRRGLDLAAFFEQTCAVEDRLVLSYVGWDEMTGSPRSPASPVRQLLAFIESHILAPDSAKLPVEHMLRRYDPAYLPGGAALSGAGLGAPLLCFSPEAGREAASFQVRRDLSNAGADPSAHLATSSEAAAFRPLLGLAYLDPQAPLVHAAPAVLNQPLGLAAFRDFLKEPLQGWAKHVLGIREVGDSDRGAGDDHEPFDLDGMIEKVTLRRAFEEAVLASPKGRAPDHASLCAALRPHLARMEAAGAGPSGLYLSLLEAKLLGTLHTWSANYQGVGLEDAGPFKRLRFGRATSSADSAESREAPVLRIVGLSAPASPPSTIRPQGETGLVGRDETVVIHTSFGKKPGITDFVKPYLECLLIAAACGSPKPKDYNVGVLANGELGACYRFEVKRLTPEGASEQLRVLAHDLLFETHAYRLPLYVVGEYWRNRRRDPFLAKFAEAKDQNYGPLWRIESYAPPPVADADRMIVRRLGPFLAAIRYGGS